MTVREGLETIDILRKAQPASLAALVPHTVIRKYRKGEQLFLDKDEGSVSKKLLVSQNEARIPSS